MERKLTRSALIKIYKPIDVSGKIKNKQRVLLFLYLITKANIREGFL